MGHRQLTWAVAKCGGWQNLRCGHMKRVMHWGRCRGSSQSTQVRSGGMTPWGVSGFFHLHNNTIRTKRRSHMFQCCRVWSFVLCYLHNYVHTCTPVRLRKLMPAIHQYHGDGTANPRGKHCNRIKTKGLQCNVTRVVSLPSSTPAAARQQQHAGSSTSAAAHVQQLDSSTALQQCLTPPKKPQLDSYCSQH
jgi:hypothetical protein